MPSKLKLAEGSFAFRMDDRMARIVVEPGDNGVAAMGWDVIGSAEWEPARTPREGRSAR